MRGHGLLPGGHEQRLSGSGGGLLLRKGQAAIGQAQTPPTQGYGPGGDQHQALAASPEARGVAGEGVQPRPIRRAGMLFGHQGRADLNHHQARPGQGAYGVHERSWAAA